MAWKGTTNNPAPNDIQENNNVSDKRIEPTYTATENRAENIRRDLDTTKDLTISLIDVDKTILNYLTNTINIHVLDNGSNIKVPVMYASPERWKALQRDGVLRDGQGKIQFPIITFGRTNVAKNPDMMSPNRHLTYPVISKYNEKNKYNPTWKIGNQAPVYQVYAVTIPDYVILTYEFICQTEFVEQMNTIIQNINWAAEDYWGDQKRFRFKVSVGDYSVSTESETSKDRVVKATFSIKVNAYLLNESFEQKKLTTSKILTKKKIVIGAETVVDSNMLNCVGKSGNPLSYSYRNGNVQKNSDTFIPAPVDISDVRAAFNTSPTIATLWHNPPANSTDYGQEGWMAHDDTYHYVYSGGRWVRQHLSNFQPF